jgi:hypothetical protein
LNPIHEGTTDIQAIDLLGRKILRRSRIGCGTQAYWSNRCGGDGVHLLSAHARTLAAYWTRIDCVELFHMQFVAFSLVWLPQQ